MSLEDDFMRLSLQNLEDFITNGQEEHLQLDFKTVNKANCLSRDDRKNLAKAISGFANSGGGLIIWGIDARKNADGVDGAIGKVVIDPIQEFITCLTEVTGQAVSPLVDGVRHRSILENDTAGFAVTIVPESDSGPHMAKLGEDRYYKRSGDSFYKMEHFDLEDMFGRRRRPNLVLRTEVTEISRDNRLVILLRIENQGRGTAKAPFFSVKLPENCRLNEGGVDGNNNVGLPPIKRHIGSSRELHFGANSNIVIHPGMILDVTQVSLPVSKPSLDVTFCGKFGAEDMRPMDFEEIVPKEKIEAKIHQKRGSAGQPEGRYPERFV
jgi:hypothetical protein